MLAERYLQRRYREGREEGRQDGREETFARLREISPPDQLEQVDHLIAKARKAMRNGRE